MKKLFLLTFISLSFTNCSTQIDRNVEGKWYMINKSGFVEWTITKDSLLNRKLHPDFTQKGKRNFNYSISEKIKLADRILLIGENAKNQAEFYTLMTLVTSDNYNSLKYIWNGLDSIFDINTIKELNQNDNRQLLGYDLYSKEYMKTFNKKKPIKRMILSDFKKFLKLYIPNLKVATEEYKKNIKGYYGEASSFNHQVVISALLELGYNPIQTSTSINSLFNKYMENEEVKKLLIELKVN